MSAAITPRSRLGLAGLVAALCCAAPAPAHAEGAAAPVILEDLRRFANTGTVLHVAAHPDDENTQLISAMARGRGYRTAYLALTRGDGGQNESGPEFGEKLGLARTQELLAARQLDGGRQFLNSGSPALRNCWPPANSTAAASSSRGRSTTVIPNHPRKPSAFGITTRCSVTSCASSAPFGPT